MSFLNPNHERHLSDEDRQIFHYPMTIDSPIIFPYHIESRTFERDFYSPDLTEGRASIEDVNNILSKFEQVYKEAIRRNNIVLYVCCFFLIANAVCSAVLGIFVIAEYISSKILMALVALYIMAFLDVLVLIIARTWSSHFTKKMRADCQQIINQNARFSSVGLHWALPNSFPGNVVLWKRSTISQTADQMSRNHGQFSNSAASGLYMPPSILANDEN